MNNIDNKYLIFEVDEHYALEISAVVEIIEYTKPTYVPDTPDYIAGMINLRGHIIPVIDIRKRFLKKSAPDDKRRCIIITNITENQLGLIVDNVIDLITIEPDNLKDPPQAGTTYSHVFIKSIGLTDGKMNLIVDNDKLINYKDIENIVSP